MPLHKTLNLDPFWCVAALPRNVVSFVDLIFLSSNQSRRWCFSWARWRKSRRPQSCRRWPGRSTWRLKRCKLFEAAFPILPLSWNNHTATVPVNISNHFKLSYRKFICWSVSCEKSGSLAWSTKTWLIVYCKLFKITKATWKRPNVVWSFYLSFLRP